MEFGLFYEHQLPRPWDDRSEQTLFNEALEQVEIADDLGLGYAWAVEHHFLEEYAHSSAPEVFLAACAQRTDQIRLGHGIKLMLPQYNSTARAAEQVATLDLVSNGRVEFGTGKSDSRMEIEGFGIDPNKKNDIWEETVEQVANMMALEPYPGYDGDYVSMPCRNVIPKPVQDPHPPMWMACSDRDSIRIAAERGIGALTFSFLSPGEAEEWVDLYYDVFESECEPIGRSVNPNVAMVTGFSCHPDEETAWDRGEDGFLFFGFALGHYYVHGSSKPGYSNLWEEFNNGGREMVRDFLGNPEALTAIGTPGQVRDKLRGYEKAGVDQVFFVQEGGNNQHEHICEALKLFADDVMPEFEERHAEQVREKEERLEPYVEKAIERKDFVEAPAEEDVSTVPSYGIADPSDRQTGVSLDWTRPSDPLWKKASIWILQKVLARTQPVWRRIGRWTGISSFEK